MMVVLAEVWAEGAMVPMARAAAGGLLASGAMLLLLATSRARWSLLHMRLPLWVRRAKQKEAQ